MGDYSAHVLDRARAEVGHHGDHVSGLVLDATRLSGTIGSWRESVPRLHLQRLRQPAQRRGGPIRGRVYLVQARSFLPGAAADEIATGSGSARSELAQLTQRLLRIGPELLAETVPEKFPDTGQAVLFWQAVWAALRQAERYVPLEGLDTYRSRRG